MNTIVRYIFLVFAGLAASTGVAAQKGAEADANPTIVLVHGAFAESASWTTPGIWRDTASISTIAGSSPPDRT